MFRLLTLLFVLSFYRPSLAQDTSVDSSFVYWNENRKLTAEDFYIKMNNTSSSLFAQFILGHRLKSVNVWNGKPTYEVYNYMVKTASWVDTSKVITKELQYMQTLFDITEVYARKLRKELKENRGKMIVNRNYINELNKRIITESSRRKAQYEQDWQSEKQEEKQKEWEEQIKKELIELNDYAGRN